MKINHRKASLSRLSKLDTRRVIAKAKAGSMRKEPMESARKSLQVHGQVIFLITGSCAR